MTEEQLREIEERANAATEGPWDDLLDMVIVRAKYNLPAVINHEWGDALEADREFICNARTDVPALIAEVRRLKARAGETE